jgi:hypothetical protein
VTAPGHSTGLTARRYAGLPSNQRRSSSSTAAAAKSTTALIRPDRAEVERIVEEKLREQEQRVDDARQTDEKAPVRPDQQPDGGGGGCGPAER